jgi:hypothetical protein
MPNSEAEYRVVYPEKAKALLRAYVGELIKAGWDRPSLRRLMQTLDDRLKLVPLGLGEPLYTLKAMKLEVRVGFVRPLAVNFGVHAGNRFVLVGKIVLMTTERP